MCAGRRTRIVTAHGDDSLSFFKLRQDNHYFFDSEHKALVAYRIERGVLLVSGDPVGPCDAIPRLLRELCAFAEMRSIKVAVVGASAGFAEIAEGAGLRSFYMGDEAIIDVDRFSLEGRAIRKVRQSVSRLRKEGYSADAATVGRLGEDDLKQLEAVSERWLVGDPSEGSRWRWTACAPRTSTTARSYLPGTGPARCAASCTSCRHAAAP